MGTLIVYALLGLLACAVSAAGLLAVVHHRTGPPLDVAGWICLRVVAFIACAVIVDNVPGTATVGEFAWGSVNYWIGERWRPVALHSAVLLPLTALVLLRLADPDSRRRIVKGLFYSSAGFGIMAVLGLGLSIFLGLRAVTTVDIPAHLARANGLIDVLGTVGAALFLMFAYVCMSIPLLIWIYSSVTTTFNASTTHPLLAPAGSAAVAAGMFATSLPNASSAADVVFGLLSVLSVLAASWWESVRLRQSLGISWSRPFPNRELYHEIDDVPDDAGLSRQAAFLVDLIAKPRWRWAPADPGPALSGEDVGDLYGQGGAARRRTDQDQAPEVLEGP